DGVRDAARLDLAEEAGPAHGVAVPGVRPEPEDAHERNALPKLSHEDVLGEHVPTRRRAPEAVEQPGFLRGAEKGSAGIPPLRTPGIGLEVPAAVVGRPRA